MLLQARGKERKYRKIIVVIYVYTVSQFLCMRVKHKIKRMVKFRVILEVLAQRSHAMIMSLVQGFFTVCGILLSLIEEKRKHFPV